jgi:hypothetical protein
MTALVTVTNDGIGNCEGVRASINGLAVDAEKGAKKLLDDEIENTDISKRKRV